MSAEAYELYLQRFTDQVADVEVGSFGKFDGKLVKKLDEVEFAKAWTEFVELRDNYEKMMEMGLTIDNIILKLLKERASALVLSFEL